MSRADAEVAIVGCGPVGQLLAILLGQAGRDVVIIDTWPNPYPLPRAVHFDDEIARVLASAGVGDALAGFTEPVDSYHWRNAAGETLLAFDWSRAGTQCWPFANMMSQPELEAVLARRLASLPTVTIRRGETAIALDNFDDGVTLATRHVSGEHRTIRARYVVGCDGANSFVRSTMNAAFIDLQFSSDWLIVDVVPHEPRVFDPINLQICDPARPVTAVSGGPGRRRFEFMRLPHESKSDLNSVERAWALLAAWDLRPANATLERHAVYTFAAGWADRWRDGRVLLAGDAAHLMPPFAGQGMCSGMRDAANLAWKLELVLSGRAPDVLLDTYGAERSAHVQNAIGMSVALGQVICVNDPQAAAARDAGMIAAGARPERILPPLPPATLVDGVVQRLADGSVAPGAGSVMMQAHVARRGRSGRFDTVVGTGFCVLACGNPRAVLDPAHTDFLVAIGAHVVELAPPDARVDNNRADLVVDVDGHYLEHLAQAGYAAVVVRPDFYVFGTARTLAELPALIDDLRFALGPVPATLAAAMTTTTVAEMTATGVQR